jgi:acyl carrier protein
MEDFEKELIGVISEALMLGALPPGFEAEGNLFEALGLDSVDALEIVMAIKRTYQVEFKEEDERNKEIFRSLRSLAAYVKAQREAA